MIYVDRSRVPIPSHLEEQGKAELERGRKFFSLPKERRAQQRYDFEFDIYQRTKDVLSQLFQDKCAYCESSIGAVGFGEIEHFRPKTQARGFEGELAPDHYWWLAYEWNNLYLICQLCNRNKRNFFPVLGERAEPCAVGKALETEKPLLLDPCNDNPEDHLVFDKSGVVAGRTERGRVTIELLGLNRHQLQDARKREAEHALAEFEAELLRRLVKETPAIEEVLQALLDSRRPYAAMRRQVITEWLRENKLAPPGLKGLPEIKKQHRRERSTFRVLGRLHRMGGAPAGRPPTPGPHADWLLWKLKRMGGKGAQVESLHSFIESVEIRNFRTIEHLKLEFPPGSEGAAGWKVLLGESGTGKSSVLQAIALALIGEESVRDLHLDPEKILRKPPGGRERPRRGLIRIQYGDNSTQTEVYFSKTSFRFNTGGGGTETFLRGYGPTRILPLEGSDSRPGASEGAARVRNLFNPYAPLCDPDRWLTSLEKDEKDAFYTAARALKDLLNLDRDLAIRDGHVEVEDPSRVNIELSELSSGYQAVLSLAADIMVGAIEERKAAGLPADPGDFQQAFGIVLLDEIDAHLHPRWKMRIVRSLKRAFTGMQFIATTHEPLCLRGLESNEVAVLKRVGGQLELLEDVPSPSGLRVDQLLTSELFGLDSTIDPELDQKFQRYYELLATHDKDLTSEQIQERDQLRYELATYNRLGYTRRDQLIYDIVDHCLAEEQNLAGPERREKLREETKKKIADIWKRVSIYREGVQ